MRIKNAYEGLQLNPEPFTGLSECVVLERGHSLLIENKNKLTDRIRRLCSYHHAY